MTQSIPQLPEPVNHEEALIYAQMHPESNLARCYLSLSALPLVGAIPEGWKLVPTQLTVLMGIAAYAAYDASGEDAAFGPEEAVAIYDAMLAAAPQPPAGQQDRGDAAAQGAKE